MKKSHKTLPRISRIAAVICLIAALLLDLPLPAPPKAAAAALKEEVVYVRLFNDGSVDEIYVVNSFVFDKNHHIIDYGNYEYVQNLSNTDTLRLKDGAVTIDAIESRLYYEGFLTDAELPWEFAITYSLDGRKMAPQELGGKSGSLKMEISCAFNPRGNREFFDRYCLQAAVTLDSDICGNIRADAGTIVAAGNNKQINFVVLPGKEAVLELTADVVDFAMPALTITGVTMNMDLDFDDVDMSDIRELMDGLSELDDGVKDLLDGIFDLREGVGELYDGTVEFADGLTEFVDGVAELNDGVQELADGTLDLEDGVFELKDGVAEMVEGADELVEGVDDLVEGVREFDDGLDELKDGVDDLREGAKELEEGTEDLYDGFKEITAGAGDIDAGLSEFAAGAQSAAAGGDALYRGFDAYFDILLQTASAQLISASVISAPLTRDNYRDILDIVIGPALAAARAQFTLMVEAETRARILAEILDAYNISPEEYTDVDQEVKSAIEAAIEERMADPSTLEAIEAAVDALMAAHEEEIIAQAQNDPAAAQLTQLYMMLAGYEALLHGLQDYSGGVSRIGSGASSLSRGMSKFTEGLKEYQDGLWEYLEGMEEFYDGVRELADGVAELKDGSRELLDGVIELRDGVVEFKDGVIELHDGVIELFDGIVELRDGVIELRDGVIELLDGAIELQDGALELRDGVEELLEGTDELYDGVAELKDGTGEIQENTQTLDADIIDGIKDAVEEMMGGKAPVNSFVSEKNGAIDAVQFVLQTPGITRPQPAKTAAPQEVNTTFWQRLLALFRK